MCTDPTSEKSLHGLNSDQGYIFSPNLKANYSVSSVWAVGVEYYGSVGHLTNFASFNQQGHQLYAAADVYFSPKWELNFGYGYGFSLADNKIAKMILGYRFR